jgi:hypothetical protein
MLLFKIKNCRRFVGNLSGSEEPFDSKLIETSTLFTNFALLQQDIAK